jgi:hypothetical protein
MPQPPPSGESGSLKQRSEHPRDSYIAEPLTGLALHNTPKHVRNVGMTGVGCYDVDEGIVMTLHSDLSCTWDATEY